jgi:hypothetical protein
MKYYQDANGVLFQTNAGDAFFLLPENGYAQPVTELTVEDYTSAISALPASKALSSSSSVVTMTMPDLLAQIPEEIIVVINAFVNGISLTADQINIWNAAYAIHENAAQIAVTEPTQSPTLSMTTG